MTRTVEVLTDPVVVCRCPRRIHLVLVGRPDERITGHFEVHCRYCSTPTRRIYHRWLRRDGTPLPDREEPVS